MKLVFILVVLSLAVLAASSDDLVNNDVQVRIERDADRKPGRQKKSQSKRQKGRQERKRKNRNGNKKNQSINKKKKSKKGKKERKGCPKGKKGQKCRQQKRKNRQNIIIKPPTPVPAPISCPPTTCPTVAPPVSGCTSVNTAYTQYKRASNWMKQCARVNSWNTIITNKGGKAGDFMAGAEALISATMNGTSCAGGPANTTVNAALDTLNNCSTSIGGACVPNANISVCEATNQCQTDLNNTKMAFEVKRTNYIF